MAWRGVAWCGVGQNVVGTVVGMGKGGEGVGGHLEAIQPMSQHAAHLRQSDGGK